VALEVAMTAMAAADGEESVALRVPRAAEQLFTS
jgi:hypothetical protein